MDNDNKKRRREEEENEEQKDKKRSNHSEDVFGECAETIFNFPEQLAVLEFQEKEMDGFSESNQEWWKLFDGFSSDFNSFEFSADGFCDFPAPIEFPGEGFNVGEENESGPSKAGEEIDGVDCIWSCAFDQPLCWIDDHKKR